MKIAHVITDLNKGGAEFALFRLLRYASQSDNLNTHIVVSLSANGYFENEILKLGFKVHSLDFNKNKFANIIKLYKLIKLEKPDVVQTWMYHSDFIGGLVARSLGIKNVLWGIHHSNLTIKANKISTFILIRVLAFLSFFIPKKIVACSKYSIKIHKRVGYKDIFFYSPLGYDFLEFKFNDDKRTFYRNKWKFKNDDFVVGIVARWDSQKDIKNLISAFSMLQEFNTFIKYVIVGNGLNESNADFLDLITSFRINRSNLILEGPTGDVQGVLCGFDLKVLSSRGEAFPNVLVEAMLCERNCLSTNVGDVSEILSNNNWIVDKENSRQLYLAIQSAYEKWKNRNVEYLTNGTSNRLHVVNNFSISKMYNNYTNFWRP
jgi:glycosyltransferase involved in cell wall biosynthesis